MKLKKGRLKYTANREPERRAKKKEKIKKIFFGTAAAVFSFVLLAAATAVFIMVFQNQDAKRVSQKPQSAVPVSPPPSAAASAASSRGGTESSSAAANLSQTDDWQLVLVNFSHKMPDTFENKIVTEFGIEMDSRIVEPYKKMLAAAKADNIKLWVSSGYRSPDKQEALFEQEIKNYSKAGVSEVDAIAKAEQSVARPGYSEHNTGLALDLNGVLENFGGTAASNWLEQHAAEYGFILRYPADKQDITKIKYEAWHYRYVGVEHAKEMQQLHMCLEEYVDYCNAKKSGTSPGSALP